MGEVDQLPSTSVALYLPMLKPPFFNAGSPPPRPAAAHPYRGLQQFGLGVFFFPAYERKYLKMSKTFWVVSDMALSIKHDAET